ncbi:protein Z600 [Drosophila subobscura]|uniref:protein Z600 n=1 Tax=Drosophila subobscura TaxID=7241 RepID=UPI00155A33E8|nr:protein Z600 [Drosophila subobscura]
MSSTKTETTQILQRLNSLRIVEARDDIKRECFSSLAPATPSGGGQGKFQTEPKKRRKIKLNRVYTYETDAHFIKARKSLNF